MNLCSVCAKVALVAQGGELEDDGDVVDGGGAKRARTALQDSDDDEHAAPGKPPDTVQPCLPFQRVLSMPRLSL